MNKNSTWWTAFVLLLIGLISPIAVVARHSDSPMPVFMANVQIGLLFMTTCATIGLAIIYLASRQPDPD